MVNPSWAKWIQRAVLKNFTLQLPGYTVLAESDNVDKNDKSEWFEVRLDINYEHLNRNSYKAAVDVNILVMATKKQNIYNAKLLTGAAAAAFGDISVVDDSGNQKFCLNLIGKIEDTYYGEVENQANMEQATVEGTLEAYILE